MTFIAYYLLVLGFLSPLQTVEAYNLNRCNVEQHLEDAEIEAFNYESPDDVIGEAHTQAAALLQAAIEGSKYDVDCLGTTTAPYPWWLD